MFRTFLRSLLSSYVLLCLAGANDARAQSSPPPRPAPDIDSETAVNSPEIFSRKLPTGVILVKGTEPSASDHATPLPEDGSVVNDVYVSRYFGLSYPLPANWIEKVKGPPPSESGSYVLAQLAPRAKTKGLPRGSILVAAQDLFFSVVPAANAMELAAFNRDHLQPYYKVERAPAEVRIGDHSFARFDYMSPVAELHWYVLSTEIRCHAVQFVFASQDTAALEALVHDMDRMKLPAEAGTTSGTGGGDVPLCIAGYATGANVIEKVDPVLTDRKFNSIPVRIVIDKKGRVKHVHLLSAFPEQAAVITDALLKWRFKPLVRNGQPVEVETGLVFGAGQRRVRSLAAPAAATD